MFFMDYLTNTNKYNDVIELNLSSQNLKKLPNISRYKNLEILYCDDNELTSLPPLPPKLKYLECFYNHLRELPPLPSTLISLNCDNNNIINLPNLEHTQLEKISFYHNVVRELPPLPSTITELDCTENKLVTLPNLEHTQLLTILCAGNQIIELPPLPLTLKRLICDNNKLTSLPQIPPTLVALYCNNNNFSNEYINNVLQNKFEYDDLREINKLRIRINNYINRDINRNNYINNPIFKSIRDTTIKENDLVVPSLIGVKEGYDIIDMEPKNISTYLSENASNFVVINNDTIYFLDKNEIQKLLASPNSPPLVYRCKSIGSMAPSNIDTTQVYVSMKALGVTTGGYCKIEDIRRVLDSPHKIWNVIPTNKKLDAVVNFEIVQKPEYEIRPDDNEYGYSYVSSLHCQAGQEGVVYKIEEYNTLLPSNRKMSRAHMKLFSSNKKSNTLKIPSSKGRSRTRSMALSRRVNNKYLPFKSSSSSRSRKSKLSTIVENKSSRSHSRGGKISR